ncbi:hypothetical protein SS50377_22046 [Spironucleus salmonicida]|uniref:Uncharacterized protein n=1 Tax=Spironucleus salmonicida TaxID=348837 RepID=A0A9P8S0X9_9EUKA|nr:hypothetical protein SS50377_22046 [Spironucleus salmonicida]
MGSCCIESMLKDAKNYEILKLNDDVQNLDITSVSSSSQQTESEYFYNNEYCKVPLVQEKNISTAKSFVLQERMLSATFELPYILSDSDSNIESTVDQKQ